MPHDSGLSGFPGRRGTICIRNVTKESFSSTRERYVGAVRFAFVLLAVLFGIQLTTFTQYLDTQTQLRRAKAQAEEARALTGAMREVAAAADALQQSVTDTLKELLSRLVEGLKGDFAALDVKVADLRGNGPLPAEPRRNLATQQLNAPGLQKPEIVFDNDLEEAQKSLQEQLIALEKSFEEQKQEADSLAKPFAFIALNLDFVAKRFPILIGCGLAIAIGWPAYRRRELASALRLVEREERESGRLVAALCFGEPQANGARINLRWPLAGLFAAAWVAMTEWQLAAAGVLTLVEAAIQTVWGLLPIAVASWYAYRIDCNLRNAKKSG